MESLKDLMDFYSRKATQYFDESDIEQVRYCAGVVEGIKMALERLEDEDG